MPKSTLSDLLRFESEAVAGEPLDDIREVSNYVDAMMYGLERMDDLPTSLRLIREMHDRLAQTELARERIRAEGLEDRITIRVTPYQDLEGRFDKIASIGMFEHVGIANHPTYFAAVRRLLEPGGIYLHHAITRRMKKSKSAFARKSAEHRALVKYIFPGGELDHIGMTLGNLEAHGFEVHDVENLREHYGRTCRLWAGRLGARMDEATVEVGAPRARLWLLYLTGCALAFERGTVQINQTVATHRKRGPSGLPPTRADLYQ